jgi:YidC/Oxa1 family membrane protein insertase
MDNKTIIAVILSFLVIVAYQFLFPAQSPQVAEQQKPGAGQKEERAQPSAPTPVAETAAAEEKEVKVETELYTAIFSSRGGTIKAWTLKSYKDSHGNDVTLLGKPGVLPPLGIGTNDTFDLSGANFSVIGKDLKLDSANKSGTLIFEFAKEGRSVRRTYTFYSDTYKVDITDEVSGFPEYWVTLGSDFGIFEKDASVHVGPTVLVGTDLKELTPKDLKETAVFKENLKWVAQEDKYFFSALVPASSVENALSWMLKDSPVIALKAKEGTTMLSLYAGPKDHDRLARLNLGLEHIINFGFFSVIARPLFWILKFFYSFSGNYGWAIILLTIVTRIPFIPLLNKSQKSMKKLQEIQPKMNEIREKFKSDPQRMQKEMMELYKKHKVSPFGGCLPILLQIPVFFALYKVLLIAIELRGAPFMLWIKDLSAPDTLFGHVPASMPLIGGFALGPLPIVMGITMVIQQKMTPSSMDPRQAKMMMLMPVIFTFMFLNFASGLVIYWLVNNVLSIIQQLFVNRSLAKKQA